jgi:hypothetical protein
MGVENPPVSGLGAWATYTPQVDQGVTTNIAATVVWANYTQIGHMVIAHVRLLITGTGTAGQAVKVKLPVTVLTNVSLFGVGSTFIRDLSAGADYRGVGILGNDSYISFRRGDTTVQSDIGVDPNIAVANGDIIAFGISYEAA